MRKSALAGVILGSVLSLTAAWAQAPQKLVVNSFGGPYEQLHKKIIFEPFEKKYGVAVQVVTAYSADALAQLRAQKNAPQYDVVHFSGGQEVAAAKEGLLTPLTLADLPNAANLYPFAREGLTRGEGPAHLVTAIGLVYNTKEVKRPPASWKDLWDPAYEDRLVLTDLSNTFGMLGFLMANKVWGGTISDPAPGFGKVRELLDRSVIIASSPELQQNFAQNGALLAPFSQDYAYILTKSGLPVKFVVGQEGVPAVLFTANLVAGRPNQELAKKLIDFSLSPEVQEAFAREMRYTPTNSKAKLDPDVAREVVSGDAVGSLIRFDPAEIDRNRPRLVEQWKKLISR